MYSSFDAVKEKLHFSKLQGKSQFKKKMSIQSRYYWAGLGIFTGCFRVWLGTFTILLIQLMFLMRLSAWKRSKGPIL